MADYGEPFTRIQASGRLYDYETWAFSLNVKQGGPASRPTQVEVDGVGDALRRFWNHASIARIAKLTGVKMARIGADGHYMDNAPTIHAIGAAGLEGGAGSSYPAPQLALAISLLGDNPRGAAGRGRFYLPGPSGIIDGEGRLPQVYVQEVADRTVTLLNEINAAVDGQVSIVGAATATGRAPASQPVATVRVGRVMDTIRSRRTSMPESPVSAEMPVVEL